MSEEASEKKTTSSGHDSTNLESCYYAVNSALPWDGSLVTRGDLLSLERFTIVIPFKKQIAQCLVLSVVDQLKPLFQLQKLGFHILPSVVKRLSDNDTPDSSRACSMSSDGDSASEPVWVVPGSSCYAVIARSPLPEGHVDMDFQHYLKSTAVVSEDFCRQVCNFVCFRWLLGNPLRKVCDSRIVVRRVRGAASPSIQCATLSVEEAAATVAADALDVPSRLELHNIPHDSREHYFDESCQWDAFASQLCYRFFVCGGRQTPAMRSCLSLSTKCNVDSIRQQYMTRLLESIVPSSEQKWDMSRLIFEWRRRIESVCNNVHPSMLWIGNFVLRRITQHLQAVDYGADDLFDT